MAITSDNDTRQTTMTVTVRVPNGADGDLTTNAQRRLSRADGVFDVTVTELRGVEPGLSATLVTIVVTVETEAGQCGCTVETLLDEEIYVERVASL